VIVAELTDVALFASMPRYGDLSVHAAVDLRRRFPRQQLERAVEATIAHFPILGRRYEPRFWRDRWVEVGGTVGEAVHMVESPADLEADTLTWVRRPIEGTRERPLRVVSLGRGEGSRLILSLLHIAVDGAGAAAVGHVLGAHLYGVPPSLPVEPRRDLRSVLRGLRWYHAPILARDAVGNVLQAVRVGHAATRERPYPTTATAGALSRQLVFSAGALARIKERCQRNASVNDILAAALARISARRSSGGDVAVQYTMDLRRYCGDPRLSAANTSAIMTILVPRSDVGDLATTVAAVERETLRQRRGLAGPAFLVAPAVLTAGLPHALVRRLVVALHPIMVDLPLEKGLIFTNVGRIDDGLRAFGADLESVRLFGPNVEGVRVPAIVAFGFRGELYLQLFGAPGVGVEALELLEAELREALELPPPGGATWAARAPGGGSEASWR